MFITFEGCKGTGKTTQANLLADFLKEQNFDVVLTSEKDCSEFSQTIFNAMMDNDRSNSLIDLFLFCSLRQYHYINVVKPALERGAIVICDRYTDSTLVYNYPDELTRAEMDWLNNISSNSLKPDITFLLELDEALSISRSVRRDKEKSPPRNKVFTIENMMKAMYGRTFKELARGDTQRISVINASRQKNFIANKIRRLTVSKLNELRNK